MSSFCLAVSSCAEAEPFAQELGALLSSAAMPSERDLIANAGRVVRIAQGFNAVQREVLEHCVRIMADGMTEFQQNAARVQQRAEVNISRRSVWTVVGISSALARSNLAQKFLFATLTRKLPSD